MWSHCGTNKWFTSHCGLVVSAPAWDGTGCEFDSWQCRIYIPCSLSLRLLGSLRGSLGTYGLTTKIVFKKTTKKQVHNNVVVAPLSFREREEKRGRERKSGTTLPRQEGECNDIEPDTMLTRVAVIQSGTDNTTHDHCTSSVANQQWSNVFSMHKYGNKQERDTGWKCVANEGFSSRKTPRIMRVFESSIYVPATLIFWIWCSDNCVCCQVSTRTASGLFGFKTRYNIGRPEISNKIFTTTSIIIYQVYSTMSTMGLYIVG